MAFSQALYRTTLRVLRTLSPAMMKGQSKLARGLRGRRDAHERLIAWGRGLRPVDRPVVWAHASSVGESIQARAVIDVLKRRMPGLQVVFTYFSPSAEGVCGDFPAEVCGFLPWDLPEVLGPVLDAVRPSVIVFTQREVWPTLAAAATARRVPTVLIAGTMPRGAGRSSLPGRILLGPAFRSLRVVGAVSKEDGERFGVLGVRSERVTVTGDPGIDAARERVAGIDREAPHFRISGDGCGPVGAKDPVEGPRPILVAGSIWPSDEEVLIPALARVRESVPGLRIVLAPHEPDGYDFAELARRLAGDGWTTALLAEGEGTGEAEGTAEARRGGTGLGANAILVDRVGVLAELYTLASVAYVGGGFHARGFRKRGLHSVLEPAAAGVPVLMGPRHEGSLHATRLLAAGAARVVADADSLAHALREWLEPRGKNEDPGQLAMDYIENHRGSAGRTADLIGQFLPQ